MKKGKVKKKKTALSQKQPNSKIRGITINIPSADSAICDIQQEAKESMVEYGNKNVNVRKKAMRYRIEYADGECCNYANSRADLLEWLKLLKDETISDIRKLYKSGMSDSVIEKYQKYI